MDLDTALLRAFVVVAEEAHFGRAAARLVISQQAVSKRIVRLETLLGAAVLDRSHRSVALTPTGAALLPEARLILEKVDAAVELVRPEHRPLRVDVLDEHLALLRFVRDIVGVGPQAAVEVTMREDHADAVTTLRSGGCDVAFGRAGAVAGDAEHWPGDIVRRTTLLEPICLLVGVEHPWHQRDAVTTSELGEASLWFPNTGSPPEWLVLLHEFSVEFGLTIDQRGSTMGFEHFLARARAGEICTLFGGAMVPPPETAGVRVVAVVDPVPVFAWSAMWRLRLPPAAPAFVNAVVARARAVTPEPHPDDAWMPATDRRLLTGDGQTRRHG